MAGGDWTPALYYDGRLAEDNDELETNRTLSPASALVVTPVIDSRSVAGAVVNPLKNAVPQGNGLSRRVATSSGAPDDAGRH